MICDECMGRKTVAGKVCPRCDGKGTLHDDGSGFNFLTGEEVVDEYGDGCSEVFVPAKQIPIGAAADVLDRLRAEVASLRVRNAKLQRFIWESMPWFNRGEFLAALEDLMEEV